MLIQKTLVLRHVRAFLEEEDHLTGQYVLLNQQFFLFCFFFVVTLATLLSLSLSVASLYFCM